MQYDGNHYVWSVDKGLGETGGNRCAAEFLNWTLGLDRCTLTYIALEETKRNEHWIEAGKRTINFEERYKKRTDKVTL